MISRQKVKWHARRSKVYVHVGLLGVQKNSTWSWSATERKHASDAVRWCDLNV